MENARRPRPKPEFGGGALERRSISEQVANRILSMIKSGNLKSGDRLPTEAQMGNLPKLADLIFHRLFRRCCTYNARALRAGPRKNLPWLRLHQPVSRSDLPEERCAQLRRALLGGIVDVEESETGAEAVGPLEIVHQAPMEIAAHRHALGRRALQLRQVATQEHDAVCVVDEAVGGRHVGR